MHFRAQISFQYDTAFPRDAISINPHYNGDNAQALADVLKTNLLAVPKIGATTPFKVRVYDAEKAPPSYPLGQAENVASPKLTSSPREVALCLSYYATWNRPGFRGRVFIPSFWISGSLGLRPTNAQQLEVVAMKNIFKSGLPSGTIWEVWSPTLKQGSGISHVWCDDEWDTMRSRGMKSTSRILEPL